MITKLEIFRENILVPRNLDNRVSEKMKINIKILSQEIVNGNLEIDNSFLNIPENLVKTKEINGDVNINIQEFQYGDKSTIIPVWLKNIKINGDFVCVNQGINTLANCPKYVTGNFLCNDNWLEFLDGCPEYVGGDFDCSCNELEELDVLPEHIGGTFICNDNVSSTQLFIPTWIKRYSGNLEYREDDY